MECAICFEVAEPFMLPCNHSICMDCYQNKALRRCPFCRKTIKQVLVHHVQIHINDPFIEEPYLTKEVCSIVICVSCMIILVWLSVGVGNWI